MKEENCEHVDNSLGWVLSTLASMAFALETNIICCIISQG